MSQNALYGSGGINMLMCSDVYRPLLGADNRMIEFFLFLDNGFFANNSIRT